MPSDAGHLNPEDIACLRFLSDKMDATGRAIGESAAPGRAHSSRGYAMVGNRIARRLSFARTPYVAWISDRQAWAITPAGRAILPDPTPGQDDQDGPAPREGGDA